MLRGALNRCSFQDAGNTTGKPPPYTRQVTVPRQPAGPLPGRLRLSGREAQVSIRAALMFVLALALTFWYGVDAVQQMRHREALRRDGNRTTGEITRLWSSGHGAYRKVSYAFVVNGTVFTGEAQVPKDRWESLRNAGSLSIQYLPTAPAINHPDAWEWSALQRLDLIVAAILCAAFGVFLSLDRYPGRRPIAQGRT